MVWCGRLLAEVCIMVIYAFSTVDGDSFWLTVISSGCSQGYWRQSRSKWLGCSDNPKKFFWRSHNTEACLGCWQTYTSQGMLFYSYLLGLPFSFRYMYIISRSFVSLYGFERDIYCLTSCLTCSLSLSLSLNMREDWNRVWFLKFSYHLLRKREYYFLHNGST